MTNKELRTLTAAQILSGLLASNSAKAMFGFWRDMKVQEAIFFTDALFEGLDDLEPLKKRIIEWSERRRGISDEEFKRMRNS